MERTCSHLLSPFGQSGLSQVSHTKEKSFDGFYSLFTDYFQGKVRVTKHKNIIIALANFFKRDIYFWLVSMLFSTSCTSFISLDTSCIFWWLFHISGAILQCIIMVQPSTILHIFILHVRLRGLFHQNVHVCRKSTTLGNIALGSNLSQTVSSKGVT